MKSFDSIRTWVSLLLMGALLLGVTSCGRPKDTSAAHDHDHEEAGHAHAGHHHDPPHGGTPIRLGDELFHLEWVKNEAANVMHCYVLDGHMEQFVRIAQKEIHLILKGPDGVPAPWTFAAVDNRATGETVGDTSEFQAPLDTLPDQNKFEGTILEVHIKGHYFENIPFRFPEGNEG